MGNLVYLPAEFIALHLKVTTSVMEYKGDTKTAEFHTSMGSDELSLKSVITKGSIRMEYPGTDAPDVISSAFTCPVFPAPNSVGKKYFKMTTLEDNTVTQCVHPQLGYRVVTEKDVNIDTGGTLAVAKGVLVFVFGDNYTINGDAQEGFQMFAVQNNDIVVSANSVCRVIVFKAIPL